MAGKSPSEEHQWWIVPNGNSSVGQLPKEPPPNSVLRLQSQTFKGLSESSVL